MSVESLISCPKMNLKGDFSDPPPRERLAHKYPAASDHDVKFYQGSWKVSI